MIIFPKGNTTRARTHANKPDFDARDLPNEFQISL
jgi:hypothetical protein